MGKVIKSTLSEFDRQALEESERPGLGDRAWAPKPGGLPAQSVPIMDPRNWSTPCVPHASGHLSFHTQTRSLRKPSSHVGHLGGHQTLTPSDAGRHWAQDGPAQGLALCYSVCWELPLLCHAQLTRCERSPQSGGRWAGQGLCPGLEAEAERRVWEGLLGMV